jgi:hypothetical protein
MNLQKPQKNEKTLIQRRPTNFIKGRFEKILKSKLQHSGNETEYFSWLRL